MFLEHPQEKNLKNITLDEFEISLMELVRKDVQPERLNPEDICEAAQKLRDNCDAQRYFNRVITRTPMPNIDVYDSPTPDNK
jgi:hypothetical protein